uniref:Uncharacterized protein n=1 Tax=Sphaerodactylus townsendi TaxID=933632 RepID=A0ACB8EGD8_9SAUR
MRCIQIQSCCRSQELEKSDEVKRVVKCGGGKQTLLSCFALWQSTKMSVDMNSQGSDSNEEDYDPNCEEEEEDEDPGDIEDYYVGVANDVEQQGADAFDPEEYLFTCLTYKESESTLNEHMVSLASALKVSSPAALGKAASSSETQVALLSLSSEL